MHYKTCFKTNIKRADIRQTAYIEKLNPQQKSDCGESHAPLVKKKNLKHMQMTAKDLIKELMFFLLSPSVRTHLRRKEN